MSKSKKNQEFENDNFENDNFENDRFENNKTIESDNLEVSPVETRSNKRKKTDENVKSQKKKARKPFVLSAQNSHPDQDKIQANKTLSLAHVNKLIDNKEANTQKDELNSYLEDDYQSNLTNQNLTIEPVKDSKYDKPLENQDKQLDFQNMLKQIVSFIDKKFDDLKEEFKTQIKSDNIKSEDQNPTTSLLLNYKGEKIFINTDLLRRAKKDNKCSFFLSKIFSSLCCVEDIYLKIYSSRKNPNNKSQFNKDIERKLVEACIQNIDNKDNKINFETVVHDLIIAKLSNFNSLFKKMIDGQKVDIKLVNSCKLNQDDIIYLSNFKEYNEDRSKFLKLQNDIKNELEISKSSNLNVEDDNNLKVEKLNDYNLKDEKLNDKKSSNLQVNDDNNSKDENLNNQKSTKRSIKKTLDAENKKEKLDELKYKIEIKKLEREYLKLKEKTLTAESETSIDTISDSNLDPDDE